MPYSYDEMRPQLFTDEGQRVLLAVRDRVHALLREAGAFQAWNAWNGSPSDSWTLLACLDRLVELGEIRRVKQDRHVASQHEVYVKDGGS